MRLLGYVCLRAAATIASTLRSLSSAVPVLERWSYRGEMAEMRMPAFRGRVRERQALDHLLENVRGGESAVRVLRGEAGIGKTALLRYCARQAAGCRVTQIAGVESELALPWAALHQLCAPLLGDLPRCRSPSSERCGWPSGRPVEVRRIGSWLDWLCWVCWPRRLPSGRVVCLVDDAQWLDDASTQVLGFVARRLLGESVALLFAVREAGDERRFPGLPALTVEDSPTTTPGRCSPPPSPATWTSRFVTGSSPTPAAIPWRCWSWSTE